MVVGAVRGFHTFHLAKVHSFHGKEYNWSCWRCGVHGALEAWELALFFSLQIGKKEHP
jgi:hypothetical protein